MAIYRRRSIARLRFVGAVTLFSFLALVSTHLMWGVIGYWAIVQIAGITLIAVVGENLISSQGYYHYPRNEYNGPFIRNVPLWIPFLWIFSIQSSFLVGLMLNFSIVEACLLSGLLSVAFDLVFLEPYLSRKKQLWIWTSVEDGYFNFIPPKYNRFTAPPGNYIVWWSFPIILNFAILLLSGLVAW